MTVIRKPIIVVGSVTMDMVTLTPQIPRMGQTVIGTSFSTTPGGKGANQAVAAARLGYPVQMIGKVGDDAYGPLLLENLKNAGVDVSGMAIAPGSSGLAPILLDRDGHNSIVVVPGANGKVNPAFVDQYKEILRSAGMVLCQLELPLATTERTLALCVELNVPVMLDPAPAAPLPESIWTQIAWLTPNETEAALYVGENLSVEEAAAQLLARGVQGIVLKRGAQGAFVASASGVSGWVKPFPVDAIDTVAAGDCFNGAFAVALMEGKDPMQAANFASAAAAISVTRRGAQASMPDRGDVDAFLASHAR
ncbi:MAG TPA: ribokinase [Terracidiphilus sp.]|jgi:ribokinase|nr:ribokinase [Terracidiphilus sp.]